MSVELETEINVKERIKDVVQEPGKYKVIFANDNETPMDFVVGILIEIFKHTASTAETITMKIHNEGSGVVGIYSHEIAEMKAAETVNSARNQGFSLQVKIEEE